MAAAGTQSATRCEIRPPFAIAVIAMDEEHEWSTDRPRDVAEDAPSPDLGARADFVARPSVGTVARGNLAAGLGRAFEFSGLVRARYADSGACALVSES